MVRINAFKKDGVVYFVSANVDIEVSEGVEDISFNNGDSEGIIVKKSDSSGLKQIYIPTSLVNNLQETLGVLKNIVNELDKLVIVTSLSPEWVTVKNKLINDLDNLELALP